MGCIVVKGWRIGESLKVGAERVGGNLRMTAGLVCSTGLKPYLQVSPETVWLTLGNGFSEDFVIVSNVSWTVE